MLVSFGVLVLVTMHRTRFSKAHRARLAAAEAELDSILKHVKYQRAVLHQRVVPVKSHVNRLIASVPKAASRHAVSAPAAASANASKHAKPRPSQGVQNPTARRGAAGPSRCYIARGLAVTVEAVIVDLAPDAKLVRATKSAAELLPPHVNLTIFHGKTGGSFLQQDSKLTALVKSGRLAMKKIPYMPMLSMDGRSTAEIKSMYNVMLKKSEFWSALSADKILVLEPDTALCSASEKRLDEFVQMDVDYIGALWTRRDCGRPGAFFPRCVGNSGLSLINRNMVLQLLHQVVPDPRASIDQWRLPSLA